MKNKITSLIAMMALVLSIALPLGGLVFAETVIDTVTATITKYSEIESKDVTETVELKPGESYEVQAGSVWFKNWVIENATVEDLNSKVLTIDPVPAKDFSVKEIYFTNKWNAANPAKTIIGEDLVLVADVDFDVVTNVAHGAKDLEKDTDYTLLKNEDGSTKLTVSKNYTENLEAGEEQFTIKFSTNEEIFSITTKVAFEAKEVTDPSEEVKPSEDVTKPSEDETEPSEEVKPSEDETEPSEEVKPSEDVTKPSEDVTKPSEDETEPSEEVKPSEDVTEPSEEAKPSEDVTKPSEDVTKPSEDVTKPSEDVTKPSEDVTEPSEEVKPSEDVTEPSEEETKPSEDENKPTEKPEVKFGNLKIQYIDVMTGEKIADEYVQENIKVGTDYKISDKLLIVDGYKFLRLANNSLEKEGQIVEGANDVIALFIKDENVTEETEDKASLYIVAKDIYGKIIKDKTLIGTAKVGDKYKITAPKIEGYEFKGVEKDSIKLEGKLVKGENVVTLIYDEKNVETKFEIVLPKDQLERAVLVTLKNKDNNKEYKYIFNKLNDYKQTVVLENGDYEVVPEKIDNHTFKIEGKMGEKLVITYSRELIDKVIRANFVGLPADYNVPENIEVYLVAEGIENNTQKVVLSKNKGYIADVKAYKGINYSLKFAGLDNFTFELKKDLVGNVEHLLLTLTYKEGQKAVGNIQATTTPTTTGNVNNTAGNVSQLPATGENVSPVPFVLIAVGAALVGIRVFMKKKD